MTDRNNAKTLADLRERIESSAAEATLADSQYDYGYLNGWLAALYWADVIDRAALDELRNLTKRRFESRVAWLNGVATYGDPAD